MKKYSPYLKYTLGICIFIYLIIYVLKEIDNVNDYDLSFNFLFLAMSLFVFISGLVLQNSIWFYITFINNINISYFQSLKIRALSELGKYIPGRVVLYGILFSSYKKHNKSTKTIALCSIFESLSSLISAVIIFFISLLLVSISVDNNIKILSTAFLILSLVFIHPQVIQYCLNIIFKLFKKEPISFQISYTKVLFLIFLNSIVWIIFGFSFYFLINSFYSVSFSNYWYLTGTFALSSFIGFIAIFVPAGLGVREGSLIILLGKILAEPYSGIASITSRLLIISGDLILVILFYLINIIYGKYDMKED